MHHLHDRSFRLPCESGSTLDASLLEESADVGPFGPASLEHPSAQPVAPEEVLVLDARAGVTPAQFVERKLIALLGRAPLSSSLRVRGRRVA